MTPQLPEETQFTGSRMKPVTLYHCRIRGHWDDAGVFLVHLMDGEECLHLEPLSYVQSPEILRERSLSDLGDRCGTTFAGGRFSWAEFDFTYLAPGFSAEQIPSLFVRLFCTQRAQNLSAYEKLLGARIAIHSEPTPWGTVDDILRTTGHYPIQ